MTKQIKQVCVYCSARDAVDVSYIEAAKKLGKILADHDKSLIYGGGSTGLMGAVTDGVIEAGGYVTGIIPEHLRDVEKMHQDVQNLIVVETMHQRKQRMAEMADAFVILPGGFGTMDEFFEILTWRQLGLHDKPILLVNMDGYWAHLISLIEEMLTKKFISPEDITQFVIIDSIDQVLPTLENQPESCVPTRTNLA